MPRRPPTTRARVPNAGRCPRGAGPLPPRRRPATPAAEARYPRGVGRCPRGVGPVPLQRRPAAPAASARYPCSAGRCPRGAGWYPRGAGRYPCSVGRCPRRAGRLPPRRRLVPLQRRPAAPAAPVAAPAAPAGYPRGAGRLPLQRRPLPPRRRPAAPAASARYPCSVARCHCSAGRLSPRRRPATPAASAAAPAAPAGTPAAPVGVEPVGLEGSRGVQEGGGRAAGSAKGLPPMNARGCASPAATVWVTLTLRDGRRLTEGVSARRRQKGQRSFLRRSSVTSATGALNNPSRPFAARSFPIPPPRSGAPALVALPDRAAPPTAWGGPATPGEGSAADRPAAGGERVGPIF